MKEFEYHAERWNLGLLKNPKKQMKEFDKLGKKGWELIAVIPISEPIVFTSVPVTKAVIAYFKREKK